MGWEILSLLLLLAIVVLLLLIRIPGEVRDFSPTFPDRLCGPTSSYWGSFPGQSGGGVKLTTRLHLMPRLGTGAAMFLLSPLCQLHGQGRRRLTMLLMLLIIIIMIIIIIITCIIEQALEDKNGIKTKYSLLEERTSLIPLGKLSKDEL
jgi:competence protein ComGC